MMCCVPLSRSKRTSLAKQASRLKGASRSAPAEHIVPKASLVSRQKRLFSWWRWGKSTRPAGRAGSRGKRATGTFPYSAPVRFPILSNKKPRDLARGFLFGGGGGNRTPVRKRFNRNFSGRRRLFTFPRPGAKRHARGLGSFMMHGALKALRTHVHHSSTPHPGPWSSRVGRSRIKQREEQVRCCSLIYKRRPF